ncbi:PREDICTED: death-associated protein kinase related-like [Nicrophorus vespilloides]|uniref:Death-associated protein kinase related-like n=1 Tax=Nicrophorus vespilloides TaxID=110193 RepID=A0ABM1MXG9_NICVS|nr:PREDICTED: death-associated protein kinase related-like [Nicrophorus vespilloides]
MQCNKGLFTLDECEKKVFLKNPVDESYKVVSIVFKGKYGIVRKLIHKKTGILYAAKSIKKQTLTDNWTPSIHHEIAVLQKCKSKSIVRLHEVFETASHVTIVMEYMVGGDLQSIFEKRECLSEVETKTVIAQLLESVRILHHQNIVHMDIKIQNVLLSKPNCLENIKLCDFGISKFLEPGRVVRALQGTLDYLAPELLKRDQITLKVDVWSIGVLTYSLVSGYTPFGVQSQEETIRNITRGIVKFDEKLCGSITVGCIKFIKSMLVLDPKLRPTVDELIKHVWLTTGKRSS